MSSLKALPEPLLGDTVELQYQPLVEAEKAAAQAKQDCERWVQLEQYHQHHSNVARVRLNLAKEQLVLRLAELEVAKAVEEESK